MRRSVAAEWSELAGVRPAVSARGLAAAVGTTRKHAWQWLSGATMPYGASLVRISRAVGRPPGAVLEACLEARERRLARLAAEKARRDAEG